LKGKKKKRQKERERGIKGEKREEEWVRSY